MDRIQLRFGQAIGLKELVATLVVSGVLLIVGTVIFAKVKGSVGMNSDPSLCYEQTNNTACFANYNESLHENTTVTGDAGSAVSNVETTTYDAFETSVRVGSQGAKIGNCRANCFSSCSYHRYPYQSVWRLRILTDIVCDSLTYRVPSGSLAGDRQWSPQLLFF